MEKLNVMLSAGVTHCDQGAIDVILGQPALALRMCQAFEEGQLGGVDDQPELGGTGERAV